MIFNNKEIRAKELDFMENAHFKYKENDKYVENKHLSIKTIKSVKNFNFAKLHNRNSSLKSTFFQMRANPER